MTLISKYFSEDQQRISSISSDGIQYIVELQDILNRTNTIYTFNSVQSAEDFAEDLVQ